MKNRLCAIFLFASALLGATARAETLVQQNVDSRVILAFRVSPAELQRWLPAPWQVNPVTAGPSKDANLNVTFIDRLLNQDAEGKPMAAGTERVVALTVPAKHGQTGEQAPVVIRLFVASPQSVPGPYKNSVQATISREARQKDAGTDPGTGSEQWALQDGAGGTMELRVEFQRGVPVRSKFEAKPHSSIEPDFFRIYRVDAGADLVKSIPSDINRVRSFQFQSSVPELRKLFDGSEKLQSVSILPWYVRQVFLP